MNPIEKIKTWLNSLPPDEKKELIGLAGYFHPNEEVYKSLGEKQEVLFMDYLEDSSLTDREQGLRFFIVVKLIDYAISGRDTDSDWTETMDLHLGMASRQRERGDSTEITDNFFKNFHLRKETWLKIARSWNNLKANEISDKEFANWHLAQISKSI